ncbi:MAG: response regulator [Chloroflexi bacterium]|nr:response regulator [Chloroflexota bacterium]
MKILIVEDEFLSAFALQSKLKQLGHKVCKPVPTGAKAIASAEREQPDIILMDIQLVGSMDGIEAAREIMSRQAIPIIFMTGYADKDVVERAMKLNPVAYLMKPLQMYELEAAIRTVQF